ncbi:MAG TPA: arabinose ABC transporter substrate-binding protein [Candidatus Brocadiia bacterium]|nr:arabinose ABC transporter substrate-binding protein [Candidatus Brocadiia bacterium]
MKSAKAKALTFVAAAIIAVCAIEGCKARKPGGATPGGVAVEKIKIGFIVKQPEEPWFQYEWQFAEAASKDLGFELIKIGAGDGEKVMAAIDNLAANRTQGFIICTPDVRLGPAIAAKAKANGLKLLSVDDQFVGADGKFMTDVHYLGISARKIGQNVGKTLWEEMKKRGWKMEETAVMMMTFDELDTARERTEGAFESLVEAGFPKEKIYKAPQKTSDQPGAIDAANALLTKHPEVKRWLVAGMNDSAVLGAVRALEGQGFNAENTLAIGINGTDCIFEFEKEKPTGFFGSMLLAPKRHGYETAEMMFKWIKDGTEPPKDTRTVGMLITRDTYKQILAEQGLLKDKK